MATPVLTSPGEKRTGNPTHVSERWDPSWCYRCGTLQRLFSGELAQLVERLLCKQDVRSSSLLFSIPSKYIMGIEQCDWKVWYLPTTPLMMVRLSDDVMSHLWSCIHDATEPYNNQLAGQISSSLKLIDKDDYFWNQVVLPLSYQYMDRDVGGQFWERNHTLPALGMTMEDNLWVNFQKQGEFNPSHSHSGVFSFVVWMKIPTEHEEQSKLRIARSSNKPVVSAFQFSYHDVVGRASEYTIPMGKDMEGHMCVFPSGLNHQVYPFYNCSEDRVSISGNVFWDARTIDYNG